MINTLSIIIPVFNEENTVLKLLDMVKSVNLIYNIKKEFVIVDDCSTDSSLQKLNSFKTDNRDIKTILINHDRNKGKGAAIKSALQHATGEYCIIQDADCELNPEDINKLLMPVCNNGIDIVYGSRFLKNKKHHNEMMLNRLANICFTSLSNFLLNIKLTDMQTCYKLIPTSQFKTINLMEDGFAFDPEITAKLAKNKTLSWEEVPIDYTPRNPEEGKKLKWSHGFRQLYSIIKYGLFHY